METPSAPTWPLSGHAGRPGLASACEEMPSRSAPSPEGPSPGSGGCVWPRRLSLPEDLKSGWHCNRPDDVCQMNNLAGHLASLQGGEMAAPLSLVLEPGDRKGGIVSGGPGGEEGEAFAVSDNKVCSFLPASLPHSGLYFGKSYFFFFPGLSCHLCGTTVSPSPPCWLAEPGV